MVLPYHGAAYAVIEAGAKARFLIRNTSSTYGYKQAESILRSASNIVIELSFNLVCHLSVEGARCLVQHEKNWQYNLGCFFGVTTADVRFFLEEFKAAGEENIGSKKLWHKKLTSILSNFTQFELSNTMHKWQLHQLLYGGYWSALALATFGSLHIGSKRQCDLDTSLTAQLRWIRLHIAWKLRSVC